MTSEGAYVTCRTCLNYSSPFSNIFKEILGEGYVYEVLMDVCQLEVSSEDGLPEYVCFDCHKNISKLHSFKLQTHESNAALHRLKINHEIKIEPAFSFTSSTRNSESSLKSTTRTMKECYVCLSRCDQLLQDRHSLKVDIKSEKEDPSYLGDNESGSIQGADMQLPVTLVGEGESSSALKDLSKEKLREETLQANTQSVVKVKKVLLSENLFSNGKEYEGDDIEIHEVKPYSEYASMKRYSPHLHFTNNTAKGVGNLTVSNGYHPFDGTYIEAEPQEIKETSENGYVAIDSNLQSCEGDPEEIISRCLERSAHPGVELNLDQPYDEKSLVTVGLKIQEREYLEEMQIECEFFESRNHECRRSECIDKKGLTMEIDKETVNSDNVVSKTYRKRSNLLEDSHVQLRKLNNRDLLDIVICDHCRKEFTEKSDLLKHLVGFRREYTCKRLKEIHKTNKDFVIHDEKHNFKASCGIEFIEKTSVMREHDKLQVESDNLVAKTYGKRGSFCEDSNVQLREEENGDFLNILVCDYCREEFNDKSDLLKHLVVHSENSNFGRISEKTEGKGNVVLYTSEFSKKRGSKKCKRKLRTKNQWKCKWCGKEFTCASALKYHERVHTGEKPFSCKYCSKKFRTKWNLSQHELTHTGVKPFSCSYCSKKFNQKMHLKRHQLTHTGVKPFSCKFCSKSFCQKSDLNRHVLIHTGVKPFSCKFCSKKFNRKSNLNKHERIHTGVKSFSCKFCSKQFNLKCNLTKHELIHTKRFRHQASLKVHERMNTRVLSCS